MRYRILYKKVSGLDGSMSLAEDTVECTGFEITHGGVLVLYVDAPVKGEAWTTRINLRAFPASMWAVIEPLEDAAPVVTL